MMTTAAADSRRCRRRRRGHPGAAVVRVASALFATAVALTVALPSSSLRAETLRFPADDPVFAVNLPDGWKTEFDPKKRVLTAQPAPDRGIALTFGEMEGVDDLPSARAALPKLVALIARGSGVADVQPKGEPQEGKTPRGVFFVAQEFTGKNQAGATLVLSPLAFQIEEGDDVYLMMVVATEEEDRKFGKDGMVILASIAAE